MRRKKNNTNKLMQINYHFSPTKIQKLQNFEKKKKSIMASMLGTDQNA